MHSVHLNLSLFVFFTPSSNMNNIPDFFCERTQQENGEVNKWLKKLNTIRNLANGKLDPNEINLKQYGILTPEQEKEEQERKRMVKMELDQKEKILKQKEKQLEYKKWWNGASLLLEEHRRNHHDKIVATRISKKYIKERYSSDYTRWKEGKFIPDDEATKQEIEESKKEKEKEKAKQFEMSNPEFCQSVIQDLEERQKTKEKRIKEAHKYRLYGNQYYQEKKYDKTLISYQKALVNDPYNEKILMNIALCYNKQKKYDDAIEFCNRVCQIYQDSTYLIKALFNKAKIQWQIHPNSNETFLYLDKCLKIDPQNKEVMNARRLYVLDMQNKERENAVLKSLQTKEDSSKSFQKQSIFYPFDIKFCNDILEKNQLECIDKITDAILEYGPLTNYSETNESKRMDQRLFRHDMTSSLGIILAKNAALF